MLVDIAHVVMNFLDNHPHWAQFITFIVAFSESLPVIGTIVPGSITMTCIGVLVGTSVLPMALTFFVATLGAFTGDFVGYWFGKKYHGNIRQMWPIKKYQHWLDSGEKFFAKHGGKSVLIGRFFGPVRSMIPMIAGILKLSTLRFVMAAIPSAFFWAMLYMLPGVMLGALSLELPAKTATTFLLSVLGIAIAVWLLTILIKLFFQKVWSFIDARISQCWKMLRGNRGTHWMTTLIADPREPNHHSQLTLALFTGLFFLLFVYTIWNIIHLGWVTEWNRPVSFLVQSIRTPHLDVLMTAFTVLAHKWSIAGFNCLMIAWLLWKRHYRAAIHWFALFMIGYGSVWIFKYIYYSPRPSPNLLDPEITKSSLPSGHTAFTLMYFGFFTVLINIPFKKILYLTLAMLVSLVAFSRLYLDAHWLSDVIASVLLGLTCLMLVTLSYRRQHSRMIPGKQLATSGVLILTLVWLTWGSYHFREAFESYQPTHKQIKLSLSQWWNQLDPSLPLYRLNRLGHPKEPLNLQWLGELENIQHDLRKQGWQIQPNSLNFKEAILIAAKPTHDHLPILPQQFQHQTTALVMTKGSEESIDLVLRLWPMHTIINGKPLWIGSISQFTPAHQLISRHARSQPDEFVDKTDELESELRAWETLRVNIPQDKLQSLPSELHWQGKVLQIK